MVTPSLEAKKINPTQTPANTSHITAISVLKSGLPKSGRHSSERRPSTALPPLFVRRSPVCWAFDKRTGIVLVLVAQASTERDASTERAAACTAGAANGATARSRPNPFPGTSDLSIATLTLPLSDVAVLLHDGADALPDSLPLS